MKKEHKDTLHGFVSWGTLLSIEVQRMRLYLLPVFFVECCSFSIIIFSTMLILCNMLLVDVATWLSWGIGLSTTWSINPNLT